jgi:hypothetical protein
MAILEFVEKPKVPGHEKKTSRKEKKKIAPEAGKEEKAAPLEPQKEEHKKEEHKKETAQPKKHGKPLQRPGFFKKFFGRKGD